MKYCRLLGFSCLVVAILSFMTAKSVKSDTAANFGTIKVSPGFEATKATVAGYTGGSYSLSAISNRDRNKKACIGFADPTPDHILVLEKNFPRLKIQINSGGKDTTLLIQGPDDNTIRCGDDTGQTKDASVEDSEMKAGRYRMWVGTFNPGVKLNYTLSLQQP